MLIILLHAKELYMLVMVNFETKNGSYYFASLLLFQLIFLWLDSFQ